MMMFQMFLRSGSQQFPGQNEMQPGRSKIRTVGSVQDVSCVFSGEIKEKSSSVECAIEANCIRMWPSALRKIQRGFSHSLGPNMVRM